MRTAILIKGSYYNEKLSGNYILNPVFDEVGDIDMVQSGVPADVRNNMTWLFRDNFNRVDFWEALNADPHRVIDNRENKEEDTMDSDPNVDTAEAHNKGTHEVIITVNTPGELHSVLAALVSHGIDLNPNLNVKIIQI